MVEFSATKQYKGLALPAIKETGGLFASKDKLDTAWGDLILAVMTPRGSRPGNREFGSALHDLLFTVEEVDRQTVAYVVNEAVRLYCPHIEVHEVRVSQRPPKGVDIQIVFGLVADRAVTQSRTIEVPKTYITTLT